MRTNSLSLGATFYKDRPQFGRVSRSRKANRKLQKLFPFIKRQKFIKVYPFTVRKLAGIVDEHADQAPQYLEEMQNISQSGVRLIYLNRNHDSKS